MKEEPELTFGETIRQPFPKLEDIATDEEGLLEIEAYFLSIIIEKYIKFATKQEQYEIYNSAYYNGVIVEWQLKQTDPHAEIKAEYEKAIADGKIVKVFQKTNPAQGWIEDLTPEWTNWIQYKLMEIDWNKLLSWSYANDEFIECELDDNSDFRLDYKSELRGIEGEGAFLNEFGDSYKYCRLAKGVEIKDEWLKEIK